MSIYSNSSSENGQLSHPSLISQLFIFLCQLLVGVLHTLHHLLQLFHLVLELLVIHLEVGNAVHKLRCLTGETHTHTKQNTTWLFRMKDMCGCENKKKSCFFIQMCRQSFYITYNSALDTSPPKASQLPEVILSSMDLLA